MYLLARSRVGRDINRHHYTPAEIASASQRPVVQRLFELIRLRNTHPAFNGRFEVLPSVAHQLHLRWATEAGDEIVLAADLAAGTMVVRGSGLPVV